MHDGSSDGHALLLASGKFARAMVGSLGESDAPQRFEGFLTSQIGWTAQEQQREFDIFNRREDRKQVEILKDKAKRPSTQVGSSVVGDAVEGLAVHVNRSGAGLVNSGEDVEQGGLPASRGAHHGNHVTRSDGQLNPTNGFNRRIAGLIEFPKTGGLQSGDHESTKGNCIDKSLHQADLMDSETATHTVRVLAFGQVAEQLGGRHHEHTVDDGTTVRDLVMALGLESWIQFGLSVAVNGTRCDLDTPLSNDVELALLPPVSGG